MNPDLAFMEQTLFVVFLWIGVWGLIENHLESMTKHSRTIVYVGLIIVSCFFLYIRGHTKKLAYI